MITMPNYQLRSLSINFWLQLQPMNTQLDQTIYHIISKKAWETAVSQDNYAPPSIEQEGFIHCSTKEQLLMPANAMFKGQTDLVLLQLNPAKVRHKIVYEDCYESGVAFPHIYGALNLDAVESVIPFPCEEDGSFKLPF